MSLFLCLFALVAHGWSATVVVAPSGGNYTTWAALRAGAMPIAAGTIIEIQGTAAGTLTTYNETLNLDGFQGTAGNEIVIRVKTGHKVRFLGPAGGSCCYLNNTRYLRVVSDGVDALVFGNRGQWTPSNYRGYTHDTTMLFVGDTHHVEFDGFDAAGGKSYQANRFERTCHTLRFRNFRFDLHGSPNPADQNSDWGDLMTCHARFVVLEDGVFSHGGHNTCAITGHSVVVRRVRSSGDWRDKTVGTIGTSGVTATGSRAFNFHPSQRSNWEPDTSVDSMVFGPAWVEASEFIFSGVSKEGGSPHENPNFKLHGKWCVVRGTLVTDSADAAVLAPGFAGIDTATIKPNVANRQSIIYNCTFVNNAGLYWQNPFGWSATRHSTNESAEYAFLNSISLGTVNQPDGDKPLFFNYNLQAQAGTQDTVWPNRARGAEIAGNLFSGSVTWNIEFKANGSDTMSPFAPATGFAAHVHDNFNYAALVTNSSGRTLADFTLTGSNTKGLGDALPHAKCTTNQTSTTINVDRAWAFYDAPGSLSYFGEQGDYVYIGASPATAVLRQIATNGCNRTNNTITLTSSITVQAGWGIWWGGNPALGAAQIRSNRGAVQGGGSGAPAAPSNLSATTISSSQINLTWTDNSSNETGFEIDRATNSTFTSGLTTATAGANATTFNSTGLAAGTTYYYRVRATNGNGDSANSNPASATTSGGGASIVYDANALTVAASSPTGLQPVSVTFTGASNGNFARFDTNAVGSFVTLDVSVANTQSYEVKVKYNRNGHRGIVQLAIDGVNLGAAHDTYSATQDLWEYTAGTTSLASGTRAFKFTATGKNGASGDYEIAIDTITLTPASGSPEINVTGNGASIADGDTTPSTSDHTDFGSADVASGTVNRTFTIQNTGTAALSVGSVSLSGTHAADFSVTTQPGTSVAAGGSTTFVVQFNPGATGVRSASLSFTNGDGNESPYNFSIQGTGTASIAFRAASNAVASSYVTSLAVPKPTGVVSGDFMLLGLSVEQDTTTITPPAGWTLVRQISDGFRMWIYRKTAGSSEPTSYTWTVSASSKIAAGIVAFSGVNATTPIQVENGAAHTSSSSTSHTTPTIATTGSTTWLVSVFGDRNATGSTWTAPSGATERVDVNSSGSSSVPSVAIFTQGPVAAGNKSHTATSSVSGSVAGMEIIALQP